MMLAGGGFGVRPAKQKKGSSAPPLGVRPAKKKKGSSAPPPLDDAFWSDVRARVAPGPSLPRFEAYCAALRACDGGVSRLCRHASSACCDPEDKIDLPSGQTISRLHHYPGLAATPWWTPAAADDAGGRAPWAWLRALEAAAPAIADELARV